MKSREKVTAFDFENAFKALSEMEIPKVESKRKNLSERFIRSNVTNALMEDYYNVTDSNDLANAQNNRKEEIAQAKLARIEKIVDLNAETPEDILPSYVGKNIIQCPQCMTLFYKDQADIEVSEEDQSTCNVSEICQHCGNDSGYTLIGKVAAVEEPAEEENVPVEEVPTENEEPVEEVEQEAEENSDQSSEDETLNLEIEEEPAEETEEEQMVVEESLKLHENNNTFLDKIDPILDRALEQAKKGAAKDSTVLITAPVGEYGNSERKVKEWARNNDVNLFDIGALFLDEPLFTGTKITKDGKTYELNAEGWEFWNRIKENTVLLIEDITRVSPRILRHLITFIDEKKIQTRDFGDKILFSIIINPVQLDADLDPAIRAKVPFTLSDDSLNEAVDKELDNKLKAHNDYIEYLKNEIEKTEKELENAKNEFVKKSIETRLDSLKTDLEAALPDALKDEVQNELPDANEVEEVKESLSENFGERVLPNKILRKNEFFLGDPQDIFSGYYNPRDRWNGWANPGFEKDEAERLAEVLNTGNNAEVLKYDANLDAFVEYDENFKDEEAARYTGKDCMTEDGIKHLYFIGSDGWIWCEKEDSAKEVLLDFIDSLDEDLEAREKMAEFEQSLPNFVEELKGNGEIHFIYKRSKVYTQVWNRDNKSIDEIMNIAKKYGCDIKVKEHNYIQLSCNTNNEENLLRAFAEINPNYSFDTLKKLQESSKKSIKEDFKDVSDEEFKNMLNNPIYYEAVEKDSNENTNEDVEELDECSLNENVSNYLSNMYKNVKSFETTRCSLDQNKLIIEGIINFNSGKNRTTKFTFIKEGKSYIGKNRTLNRDLNFTLDYKIKNKTIITESFR